jgi:hypothetical protein
MRAPLLIVLLARFGLSKADIYFLLDENADRHRSCGPSWPSTNADGSMVESRRGIGR